MDTRRNLGLDRPRAYAPGDQSEVGLALMETLYVVRGAGVTIICPLRSMQDWIADIIAHQGIPVIEEYKEAA